MNFKSYFFDLLPEYFRKTDSPQDEDGKGFTERYLEIFGEEIDEEVLPLIAHCTDLIDPLEAPSKFFSEIAYTLGEPPDIFNGTDDYRKMLLYAVAVHKIKGTKKAFDLLFGLLGFTNVIMIEHENVGITYDSPAAYDEATTVHDLSEESCLYCADYSLEVSGPITVTDWHFEAAELICRFNEPINTGLRSITLNTVSPFGGFSDGYSPGFNI